MIIELHSHVFNPSYIVAIDESGGVARIRLIDGKHIQIKGVTPENLRKDINQAILQNEIIKNQYIKGGKNEPRDTKPIS